MSSPGQDHCSGLPGHFLFSAGEGKLGITKGERMNNAVRWACLLPIFGTAVFAAGCRLPAGDDDPAIVTSLRFSPGAFDSFRSNTELKYSLKSPATVSMYIMRRDTSGKRLLVRTLALDLGETKGSHAAAWLGDTDGRLFAPAGTYLGVVEIGTRRFETSVEVFHF
jgi:hypothetical protein